MPYRADTRSSKTNSSPVRRGDRTIETPENKAQSRDGSRPIQAISPDGRLL